MKIALTGASGTGKTTLANQLAAHYNLPLEQYEHPYGSGRMTSLSRALAYEFCGVDQPYEVDRQGMRRQFQWEGIKRKRDWELAHSSGFVTDRTHLDWLTYSVLHDIDLATDEAFNAACFEYANGYDLIVFCTMQRFFNLGTDSARKSSVLYQEIYEANLSASLGKLALRGIRVLVPRGGDSVEEVVRGIGRLL